MNSQALDATPGTRAARGSEHGARWEGGRATRTDRDGGTVRPAQAASGSGAALRPGKAARTAAPALAAPRLGDSDRLGALPGAPPRVLLGGRPGPTATLRGPSRHPCAHVTATRYREMCARTAFTGDARPLQVSRHTRPREGRRERHTCR